MVAVVATSYLSAVTAATEGDQALGSGSGAASQNGVLLSEHAWQHAAAGDTVERRQATVLFGATHAGGVKQSPGGGAGLLAEKTIARSESTRDSAFVAVGGAPGGCSSCETAVQRRKQLFSGGGGLSEILV